MKFNFETGKSKFEEVKENYNELYELIKNSDTVSDKENEDWSLDNLERQLSDIVKQSGEKALKENKGVIYTTLSGGLDSTLSLAILRKNFPNAKIITFALGSNEKHPDIIYSRLAAKKYETEHIETIPSSQDIHTALLEYQEENPDIDLKKAAEGNFDVFLLYKKISQYQPKSVIVHDGIDEQMGGYWDHRKESTKEEKVEVFKKYWKELTARHLEPLIKTSKKFNIKLIFPYLDKKLVNLISEIPVEDRASNRVGKKPLCKIAKRLGVPDDIIERKKIGQNVMTEIYPLSNIKNEQG